MTNTKLIAKIKAEIKRRRDSYLKAHSKYGRDADYIAATEDLRLLEFLDTLESEKQMQEGLEEELERFIASGKSVTVEDCGTYKVSYHDFKKVARHFAEWQKAKDDRYVDTIYQQGIEKGKDDMKELMMKEAVEGEYGYFSNASKTILPSGKLNIKEGDKVRIIIVKEGEK